MAKYFLTNKAVDDLSKIWNYSYEVWSEKQADKYYNELLGDCHELAKNQNLGKIYSEIYKDLFGYKSGETYYLLQNFEHKRNRNHKIPTLCYGFKKSYTRIKFSSIQ
jgi:toxin ParE1/3/4